jgi:hypothetical protein
MVPGLEARLMNSSQEEAILIADLVRSSTLTTPNDLTRTVPD